MTAAEEELKAELLSQTSKIPWKDLQRFFAGGKVIFIDNSLDLINIAYAVTVDDTGTVKHSTEKKLMYPVTNDQAKNWYENDAQLWAVVVKPWVLVQDKNNLNILDS